LSSRSSVRSSFLKASFSSRMILLRVFSSMILVYVVLGGCARLILGDFGLWTKCGRLCYN
jgi:hypothetical protein